MGAKKLNLQDYQKLISEDWANSIELVQAGNESAVEKAVKNAIGVSVSGDIVKDLESAKDNQIMHVIQPEKFDFEKELNTSALMTVDPNKFFSFPAASILKPTNVTKESEEECVLVDYEYNKSSDKHPALILLEVELEKVSSNQSLITTVRTIADEMFTNSIYNAPFIGDDNQTGAVRSKKIQLPDEKKNRVFLAKDDQRLIIGCEDAFGTLDISRMINKVHSCFKNGVAENMQMNTDKGAGIGSFMLFDSSTSVYVGVKPNEKTIFACSLPLNMSSRRVQQLPKSFHFLNYIGD